MCLDVSSQITNNSDDLTLEQIACLPEPQTRNYECQIESTCKYCLTNIKNENYYRTKYNKLLKITQFKDIQITELKRRCKNIGRRIKRSNLKVAIARKCRIEEHISKLDIHQNAKNFCKMLTNDRSKNQKWPEDQKIVAQNIYYRSTSVYNYLRANLNFNLPCKSSLVRWQPIKYLSPGFNNSVLAKIKENWII